MNKVVVVKVLKKIETSYGKFCLFYEKDCVSNTLLTANLYNSKLYIPLKIYETFFNFFVWLKVRF